VEISERIQRLTTEILFNWKSAMGILSPNKYVSLLDSVPPFAKYNQIPNDLDKHCRDVEIEHGGHALATLHKLVLARLISQFEVRVAGKNLSPGILALYRQEHDRVIGEMNSNPTEFYSLANDVFLKDLGLARTLLIPAGVEFVQLAPGVPRSVIFNAGFRQFFSSLYFFFGHLGGFGPFYEIHMDPRRRKEFSPDTRAFCYRIVADLLTANRNVKGLLGSSWFYDPALAQITPHLSYLCRVPTEHGAKVYYSGDEGKTSGALLYSRSRRLLFEQGKYKPKTYFLIWPREDLLRWAAEYDMHPQPQ
jgi:hypothetical protein